MYVLKDNEPGNAHLRLRLASLKVPESCWRGAIEYAIELGIKLDDEGQQRLRDAMERDQHKPGWADMYNSFLKHRTSLKPFPE